MARGDDQAFPLRTNSVNYESGLSIREYFALKIYTAGLASSRVEKINPEAALKRADELLEALGKR